jgi:hydroxymethylpyrimidine/phosphomethylpyrimidine kinase
VALSRPVALTIAGSDSSGGAGVVADLKVFEALGVWGTVAVAAVTAQNSFGVSATHLVPPEIIEAQIAAVAGDVTVAAAKTGMLGSAGGVAAAAHGLAQAGIRHLVVDPVLRSSHGQALLADDALDGLRRQLLPRATVVTPNLPEASALVGRPVANRQDMEAAARELRDMGPSLVLLKGGHLEGGSSADLIWDGDGPQWLEAPRLAAHHTHGTGCVLSAAICAYLALGEPPAQACRRAKRFVTAAIKAGGPLGRGIGPVNPTGSPAAPG